MAGRPIGGWRASRGSQLVRGDAGTHASWCGCSSLYLGYDPVGGGQVDQADSIPPPLVPHPAPWADGSALRSTRGAAADSVRHRSAGAFRSKRRCSQVPPRRSVAAQLSLADRRTRGRPFDRHTRFNPADCQRVHKSSTRTLPPLSRQVRPGQPRAAAPEPPVPHGPAAASSSQLVNPFPVRRLRIVHPSRRGGMNLAPVARIRTEPRTAP